MAIKVTIIPSGRDEDPRELVFPKSEIRIGRGLYNDIVLDSLDVSTNHAILTVSENENKKSLTISDLGSSSGTRLEGAPIPSRFAIQMSPSQRIEIGGFVIKVDFLGRGKDVEISGQSARELKMKELRDLVRDPKDSEQKEQALPFGFSPDRGSVRDNWREALFEPAPAWTTPNPIVVTPSAESPLEVFEKPAIDAKSDPLSNAPSSLFARPRENIGALRSARSTAALEPPTAQQVIYVSPENLKSEESDRKVLEPSQVSNNKIESAAEHVSKPSSLESQQANIDPKIEKLIAEDLPVTTDTIREAAEEDNNSEYDSAMRSVSKENAEQENSHFEVSSVLELGDMEIDSAMAFNIIGTVLAGTRPLENVQVRAGQIGLTATDANGKFSFEQIAEGSVFTLTFEKSGYRFLPDRITGSLDSHKYLTIGALELTELRGRITRAGQGLEDVVVNAGNLGTVRTAHDGSFIIPEIPANSYIKITFEKELFIIEPPEWEGLPNTLPSSIDARAVQLISLTGRLLRAGKPLSGIEIEGGPLGRAITGTDGRYTFYNVREDMQASLTPMPGGKSFALHLTPKRL